MKRQSIGKLKWLLMGLNSRYENQQDYFEAVEFEFQSASQPFKGSCYADEEDQLSVHFLGESKRMDMENYIRFLLEQSSSYDALRLHYMERGMQFTIEADDRKVVSKHEERKKVEEDASSMRKSRSCYIKPSKAQKLLKEIGIMSEEGKIKNDRIRKYNQIDYFVEVVHPLLDRLSDKETITILDSGCGKSYLTFVLNYYIKEELRKNCYFIGVDNKESVVRSSQEMAKRLGYKNMEFVQEDLRVYEPNRAIDLLISLHACDVATDYAIALGLRAKVASMIIVPCCHRELKDQIQNKELEPMIKHKVFRARFNDFLTDSLRSLFMESCGYEVRPIEYVSPVDTPKNLMLRAFKTSEENLTAKAEYEAIKKAFSVSPTVEKYQY